MLQRNRKKQRRCDNRVLCSNDISNSDCKGVTTRGKVTVSATFYTPPNLLYLITQLRVLLPNNGYPDAWTANAVRFFNRYSLQITMNHETHNASSQMYTQMNELYYSGSISSR